MVAASIHVIGIVQGVAFRATAKAQAVRLGLVGWVRNEPDGSVRAVVEGDRGSIDAFIKWCRRGPPVAHVEDVRAEWIASTGGFRDFSIHR